ncbi:hypothetical protein [Paractinoplanes durhamensis]|uniref:Uncharacterized protein n=1 Tax=Paractinoplanes durhamensis TaxID=113563 RepID=A0ABQ3ZAU1_9ACTN|nr:hypothetical protein [Actinoplanes durhamensis]GIE06947.1 hypothetical protein Adu01nite_82970 [Actinoplanes durhamensis]
MWDRAQVGPRRAAFVALGAVVMALGVWGLADGPDSLESVPLVTAPEWMPVPPSTATPAPAPTPSVILDSPTVPELVDLGRTEVGEPPAAAPTTTTTASAAPVTPLLTVTAGAVPNTVDLSREGTRDWIHWGLTDGKSVDRKSGVAATIQDLGSPGPRGRYDNNPQLFTWSDGNPNRFTGGTPTGIYTCGKDAGFVVRVPASTATRTVHLYAGVWQANARLTVTLDGATPVARTLTNTQAISTARFEIRFRAAAGSKLTMTWTATDVYNRTCGNVDMQAVTLS